LLEFSGERLVPGQVEPDLLNEHLARYAFAARLARGKRILDIACGAGYGTAELARQARLTVGLDISQKAVSACAATYAGSACHFLAADACHTPFVSSTFDLVVAFEVIEHLADFRALLEEARRLLAPGGQFVLSTPNRLYYASSRRLTGPNPYHVHEFEYEEFRTLLASVFPSVTLFLQNHTQAILFQPASGGGAPIAEAPADRPAPDPNTSHFFLAVCATAPQTGSPLYAYIPSTGNILAERENHIQKLEEELRTKDGWLEDLKTRHSALHGHHEALREDFEQKSAWAAELDSELQAARARIVSLQDELETSHREAQAALDELNRALEERTLYAQTVESTLGAEISARSAELARCVELLHQAETTIEERTVWAQNLDKSIAELQRILQDANQSRWLRLGRSLGVGPDFGKV
jgi:SAM-dependent methyltransferase